MAEAADHEAIHSIVPTDGAAGDLFVRPVLDHEIPLGIALASSDLREAQASEATLRRVHARNPDSLWGIFRQSASAPPAMIGFCTFLILNAKGAKALLRRRLDVNRVDVDLIAPAPETADLVYVWGVLARGFSATAVALINDTMSKRYRGRPLYATAGTEAGLRLMMKSGYVPAFPDSIGVGALYRRVGRKPEASGARHRPLLAAVPVSTADEFEKALAIRHVFLSEQNCPYEEEFDGNDRTGTLFLGSVDGEPAATLRIRYFANFFKMERLAVLPRFRRTLIAKTVVEEAINFCRRKGYTRGFGHAQKRYEKFWGKFGFRRTERDIMLVFSDHEYIEMYGDLAPDERALTMDSDPFVMIRPEGRWDEVGILELSARRPAMSST